MAEKDFLTDAEMSALDADFMSDEQMARATSAPERTVAGTAKDIGISALKSAISVPEAAVGLADIVTGGAAGKAVESAGVRFKDAKNILDENLSDAQKAANARVDAADGFLPTAQTMLENPSTIGHAALESAASMGAGGVAARGLMGLAPKVVPWAAGAFGEGLVGAGSAAEGIRQKTADGELSIGQSGAALASGVVTGAIGAAGGKIAQKLGFADIDTMLAKGGTGMTSKGVLRRIVEGGISEGVFEEMPQSAQEQVWQNAALGRPLTEGVAKSAAQGMLVGGLMGGGVNAITSAPTVDDAIDAAARAATGEADVAITDWKTGDLGPTGLLGAPSAGPTLQVTPDGTVATPEQMTAQQAASEQARLDGMTAPATPEPVGIMSSVPIVGQPTVTPDTSGGRTDTTGVRADDLLMLDTAQPATEPLVVPQTRVPSDIEAYQAAEQKQARGELLSSYERTILDAGPVATPSKLVAAEAPSTAEQRTAQRKLEREGGAPVSVAQQQLAAQETPALGPVPVSVGGINEAQLDNEQLTAIIADPATHANTRRAAQAVLGARMSQPRSDTTNLSAITGEISTPDTDVTTIFGPSARLRTASEAPQPGERVTATMRGVLTQMGRLTGTKVVFVSAEGADGATRAKDGNTVYVNVRSSINPLQIMGHETTHVLKRKHREAWAAIREAVGASADSAALAEFGRDYWSASSNTARRDAMEAAEKAGTLDAWLDQSPADAGIASSEVSVREFLLDEMIADLGGGRWSDPAFWDGVFGRIEAQHGTEKAKGIIAKLVAAIKEMLAKFMVLAKRDGFAEFKTEGMLERRLTPEQITEIRNALESAYAQFISAERRNEPAGVTQGERAAPATGGVETGDELEQMEGTTKSEARTEDRADYTVETTVPAERTDTQEPMPPERLRTLRRAALLLERPTTGLYFRVTDDGQAIATGEPGVKIPQTMRDFARKYGLRFEARRNMPVSIGSVGTPVGSREISNSRSTISGRSEPMPGEYRESGAQYSGEMDRSIDRTDKTRFAQPRAKTSDVGHKRTKAGDYVGAPVGMTASKLGALRTKLRALADEGKQGRMWYEESGIAILEAAEGNIPLAEKIAGLLAIYSPSMTVSSNTTVGLKALYQWMNGQKIKAKTGVQDTKAQEWMDGTMAEDAAMQIKTGNFFRNLMRKIDESRYGFEKQGATIDMWMARVFGYNSKAIGSSARYNFAEREVKRLATELGWEPQQVQAALWVAIKSRIESIADEARKYGQMKRWLKKVENVVGNKTNISWSPIDAASRDKYEAHILKLAMTTGADPKGLADAAYNFGTALQERVGQVSWEAMPGRTSGVLPGIFNAPLEQQTEYLVAMDAALRNNEGFDLIASRLGLPVLYTNMGPSAWEGAVGAGAQTTVAVATDRDQGNKAVTVNPNARTLLNAYAAIRGYVLSQEAVVWHYPIFTATKKDANGIQIDIGRDPTTDETRELYQAISDAAGRTDWAPAYVPAVGWRILNFDTTVPNTEFAKRITSVLSSLPDTFPASKFRTFKSDGDYISNDWKENPNGEGYRSWISGAGRSDLQGWVEGDLRDRTRRVEEDFARRYGWDRPDARVGGRPDARVGGRPDARVGGRPDAAGDRPAGDSVAQQSLPRYGQPADRHAVSVVGVHYSQQQREALSSAYFGTGLKGQEQLRLSDAKDPHIKRRLYFYANTGRGIGPEAGVGAHAHSVGLDNVYDMDVDPLRLYRKPAPGEAYRSPNQLMNDFESAVIDAGYDGYMTREFGRGGAAVLLGDHTVPVQYEGAGVRPEVEQVAGPQYDDAQQLRQRIAANTKLPAGQMTGLEWKRLLMREMPEVDPHWMDNEKLYRKGDLVPSEEVQRSEMRAVDITSAAFKRWAAGATVIKRDDTFSHDFVADEPVAVQVLHGTTGDFAVFERSRANVESDMGAGFYATNDDLDASVNYAGEGPDLTLKLGTLAERIVEEEGFNEMDPPELLAEARRRLSVHNLGFSMPVWMRFEKPFVLGGPSETQLTYDVPYNEETDEHGEETGSLVDFIVELRNVASQYNDGSVEEVVDAALEKARDYGQISATDLFNAIRESEEFAYYTDNDEGALVSNEIFRQTLENIGYDGVIDQTVDTKFGSSRKRGQKMRGVTPDTKHFIAFSPTQIKSAISNTGAFSDTDPDIRRSETRSQAPWYYSEWAQSDDDSRMFSTRTEAENSLGGKQPGFTITNTMRDTVAQGLPLFSPARGAITGQPIDAAWTTDGTIPSWDEFVRKMQDKLIDTKRIVAEIRKTGIAIKDKFDPYLQEILYHGRAAKAVSQFGETELRPLLVEMQARGVEMQELEDYLWAKHATERNAQVAKINPRMPDGGSGLTNQQAADILSGQAVTVGTRTIQLQPSRMASYASLEGRVRKITDGTLKLLVSSGLETQETTDKWRAAYRNYVPLMRDMEEDDNYAGAFNLGSGTGQGFSVRGSASKRAMGSERGVIDILANVAMQRERAITRAEKNRVSMAVYGLALTAPNPDFWLPINPDAKDPKLQAQVVTELVAMGLNPLDAAAIAKEPVQQYTDPTTGVVMTRINPQLRQRADVLAVRVNGKDRFVMFSSNDRAQAMVRNLKNLDAEQMGEIMTRVAGVTRYFASVNTQYNPVFGLTNGIRDLSTGMLNLSSTPLKGQRAKVAKYAWSALRGIYSDLRDHRAGRQPTSQWALEFEEFQREGGQTGYRDMFVTSDERAKGIADELAAAGKGQRWLAVGEKNSHIFGWLSDYNTSIENAIRLAAYRAAKEDGMSREQAAALAKNLTVNFNKKGLAATQTGALYAFFNAAVQGTARISETMTKRDPVTGKFDLSDAGRRIAYGGITLGVMQAVMFAMAGYDDEEPPQFIREKSIIIPLGERGKYLSIPMPLGFHVLSNLGRIPTEFALSGFKKPGKRILDLFRVVIDGFNPIGSSTLLQMVTPTVVDPLAAMAENKDWSGKPIYREDFNKMEPTAGWTRTKDTASDFSKFTARAVNYITGGGKYGIGVASWTPDQLDYLIGQATGGVGRESLKVWQAAKTPLTGEELPLYKVPVAGRFVGTTTGQASEMSKFYDNIKRIGEADSELKAMRQAKDGAAVARYMRENPDAMLVKQADKAYRDLALLKRQKREAIERKDTERVRLIEMQLTARVRQYNKRLSERGG